MLIFENKISSLIEYIKKNLNQMFQFNIANHAKRYVRDKLDKLRKKA